MILILLSSSVQYTIFKYLVKRIPCFHVLYALSAAFIDPYVTEKLVHVPPAYVYLYLLISQEKKGWESKMIACT